MLGECVKATLFFGLFNMYCSLLLLLFFPIIDLCSFKKYLFIYLCELAYIYCYTDTTNFIIFLQLLRCQLLISWNKNMRLWPTTTENKCFKKMLQHLLLLQYFHNCFPFTIVEISVSYISNKKMLNPQHFNINFTTNHR